MLSKKHYKKFAEIINISDDKDEIARRLIDYFGSDNPKFNEDKFREAINARKKI